MNPLTEEQIRRNRANRSDEAANVLHRQRVTQLLLEGVQSGGGKLCVLGAGNCNDLDLSAVARTFAEAHLVDIDAGALQTAFQRQNIQTAAIELHGGLDVTGVWDRLALWDPRHPAADEDVDRCLVEAGAFSERAPSMLQGADSFDRCASLCLLSQLIEGVVLTLGEGHPRFLEVLQTIRRNHLQLMISLLRAGGEGLLVSDIVSSETCAELPSVSEADLPDLVRRLIEAGNFFHGLNPAVLMNVMLTDPELAPRVEDIQVCRPWRWNVGRRVYAVFAIRFQKASSKPGPEPHR